MYKRQVIACGVNDLAENDGQPCSIERVFADIRLMAETGAARGFKVVIGSTPPANRIWWQSEEWNAAHADLGQRVEMCIRDRCQVAEQRYSERKLDPQSHTTNPLTEAADTLLDLADTKAYEEQQRIIQRRKNENRINNIC